ncbi:hypothetical protein [Rhodococcus sp. DN22]|uniref:hypothetical protein n=1 Tax=Rhodococcus sp. DN22 TaxID=357684 RepID=UPI0030CB84F3
MTNLAGRNNYSHHVETTARKLEALLAGLPKNEIDGKEIGDQGTAVTASASAELLAQAEAAIKASADKGSILPYS